ncbi:MAG: invasion associated locus B family protein, partial [Gemmobacter sp.]
WITFRAGEGGKGEVSYTGGYPFAEDSTVKVDVDGTIYELFTDGEYAWTAGADQDAALIAALKRGTTAVITGASGRGTQTKDTISLRGFTAAMEEAAKRCK